MSDLSPESNPPAGCMRRVLRPLIGDVRWQAPGWMRGIGNEPRCLVDLEEAEVAPARNRQQHPVGAVDPGLEQRA